MASLTVPLGVALFYDMDACRAPTGVTRHALAQLARLARRPEIALKVVSGRISEPDGLAYWESLEALPRRERDIRPCLVTNRAAAGPQGRRVRICAGFYVC